MKLRAFHFYPLISIAVVAIVGYYALSPTQPGANLASAKAITANPVSLKKYLIKTGSHYCNRSCLAFFCSTKMTYTVRFDSSAIYKTLSAENQYDINKLFGFTDNCSLDPLKNSARMGWRWSDDSLRVFAYIHRNGAAQELTEIRTIAINQEYTMSIKVEPNQSIFFVDGDSVVMPRNSSKAKACGICLYPYFGGDEPSPRDIAIWMQRK
jgi:hypothetical protein